MKHFGFEERAIRTLSIKQGSKKIIKKLVSDGVKLQK